MILNIYTTKTHKNTGGTFPQKLLPRYHIISQSRNKETKLCVIIEFSCSLDTNLGRKVKEKLETYDALVRNHQIFYLDYKYEVAPIIIEAIGYVPKTFISYLKVIGFEEKRIKNFDQKTTSKIDFRNCKDLQNIFKF